VHHRPPFESAILVVLTKKATTQEHHSCHTHPKGHHPRAERAAHKAMRRRRTRKRQKRQKAVARTVVRETSVMSAGRSWRPFAGRNGHMARHPLLEGMRWVDVGLGEDGRACIFIVNLLYGKASTAGGHEVGGCGFGCRWVHVPNK